MLASFGSLARFKDVQRIFNVGENTLIAYSGDVSDAQHIQHLLEPLMYLLSHLYLYSSLPPLPSSLPTSLSFPSAPSNAALGSANPTPKTTTSPTLSSSTITFPAQCTIVAQKWIPSGIPS